MSGQVVKNFIFFMKLTRLYFTIFLLILSLSAYPKAQFNSDSLISQLNFANDSSRISILLSLSWNSRNSTPERSIEYGLEAIDLSTKFKDYENLAKAHSFIGVAYRVMGNFSKSIDYYYKGLEIAKQYGVVEQEGFAYLNLANLHIHQEHYAIANENIKKAEAIAQKMGNKEMLAYVYVYYGSVLQSTGELNKALEFYSKALELRKETQNIPGQAACYKHIGDIYFEKCEFSLTIENYDKSFGKFDKITDKNLYADILIKKSIILVKENKVKQASELAHQSLDIANQIGAKLVTRDALQVLATISIKTKDYKAASSYLQKVIEFNDTLFSQKLSEKIFSIEYQLEKQLRESRIELLNKDYAIKELEVKRIKVFNAALSVILGMLAIIFIGSLLLLKIKRERTNLLEKQNQEIINQRNSIEQKNKRLNEANEKLAHSEYNLKKLIKTKDKLFSIIAHDLRGPFIGMVGLTSILEKKALKFSPEEVSKYAFLIHDSSLKLLTLIDNLLHWSRSQTGKLKLLPKSLLVKNLVDDVLTVMKTQADAKNIQLQNEVPENSTIFADYDSMATVIRNLVSNAIKFTGSNGLITISASRQFENTEIIVSDTGVGINPDDLGKIFKIEENFSKKGTNQEGGTGLGLIICKEFVEKNGGSIKVESKLGSGTKFILSLPSNHHQIN